METNLLYLGEDLGMARTNCLAQPAAYNKSPQIYPQSGLEERVLSSCPPGNTRAGYHDQRAAPASHELRTERIQ